MKVSIPPRFGVSAPLRAAVLAMQRTAARPATANADFLIIASLRVLLDAPGELFSGTSSEAKGAAVHRGNATARWNLTHLATAHPVVGAHLSELRTGSAAALDSYRATRMEHTAERRIDRARHLTFQRSEPAAGFDARIRHRLRVVEEPVERVGTYRAHRARWHFVSASSK